MEQTERERLSNQLYKAEKERDAWKGTSEHHYRMASLMVESIKRDLAKLDESGRSNVTK